MQQVKRAIITGASRGIGRGIALVLAENGYDIAITYSKGKDEAGEVAKLVRDKYNRRCILLQADLDTPGIAEEVVNTAIQSLDGLELLVNNAGKTITEHLTKISAESFDYLVNLNFRSYVMAAKVAAKYMVENGIRGNIISITSSRGTRAYPGDGIYGGLKAAIERAMQSFALDLAPYGIRVNVVAPGATMIRDSEEQSQTYKVLGSKIPLGRMGTPQDIGEAVLWLSSEKASYITGITLRVDGGLILPGMPERVMTGDIGWGFVHKANLQKK